MLRLRLRRRDVVVVVEAEDGAWQLDVCRAGVAAHRQVDLELENAQRVLRRQLRSSAAAIVTCTERPLGSVRGCPPPPSFATQSNDRGLKGEGGTLPP
eukprot:6976341-Prymnesium_polylepis.1